MHRIFQSLKKAFRFEDWWFSKIPPLLAVALFLLLPGDLPLAESLLTIFCVFVSIICVAAYGYILNDVFDVESDALAGKLNSMSTRSGWQRFLACFLPLVLGFVPGLFAHYPPWGWGLLALNCLWPTVYSVPPIRIKERGFGGILLDAAGAHVTPTLFVLVVLSDSFQNAESLGILRFATIACWSAVLGLKGILYHQLADWSNDEASATKTWARSMKREHLARFLPRFNIAVEFPANVALVLAFLPWSPLSGIFLLLYIFVEVIKNRLGFEFALDADPRNNRRTIPFCNDLFYDCWLPLSVAVHLALSSPAWIWFPFVLILVFGRSFRVLLQDLRSVGIHGSQRVRAR